MDLRLDSRPTQEAIAQAAELLGCLGDRPLGGEGIEPEVHGSEALEHGC